MSGKDARAAADITYFIADRVSRGRRILPGYTNARARANYPSLYRGRGIPRRERVAGGAYNIILRCARVRGIIFIVAGHRWPKNVRTTQRHPGIVGCKWRREITRGQ